MFSDNLVVQADGLYELEILIKAIRDWVMEHKSEVNKTKTKIFEIRKQMVNCPDGENIQDYGDYKYLGIPIDSSLKMSSYFDQQKKKVNRLTAFT
jgi:hypothetical protein